MITSTAFAGKHYAVLGLARSGLASVEALLASGAKVTAWDDDPGRVEAARVATGKSPSPSPRFAAGRSLSLRERERAAQPRKGEGEFIPLAELDLTQFDSLVVSPGIPLNRHPIAQRAREAGVEIIGDIELFARARAELPPHKVVGITGTNGKSTTTALVHHILHTAGVPSLMGGNIGLPILAQNPLPEGGVYVLELSSYQIDLTKSLDCDVAVLLNITPDHLDRYDGFEGYAGSKVRLFEMQREGQFVIIDNESDALWGMTDAATDPRIIFFDDLEMFPDVAIVRSEEWPALKGPHNQANAAAAAAAVSALDQLGISLSADVVVEGLRTFSGMPHRMERIRDKDGVTFVNDSKATNAEAAAPALAAFERVRWIVGGQAKAETLGDIAGQLTHVRKAYTIGEAGAMFARLLREARVEVAECGTLDAAVKAAASDAQPGDTVLLSPACASFDQFADFEARGDAFRAAVEAL